jgi:uncharacterized membrane protein
MSVNGVIRARKIAGFGPDTLAAALLLLGGTLVFLFVASEPYRYTLYLSVHIVAALVWVGGAVTMTLLGIVFQRRQEPELLAALGRLSGWIGPRVYTPATVLVFVSGLALMHEAEIDWGQFWVLFALFGWALAALLALGFIGPQAKRVAAAVGRHGPASAEAQRLIRQLYAVARLNTALLVLIVLDMSAKPFV